MKNAFKPFLKFHVIPILIAISAVWLIDFSLNYLQVIEKNVAPKPAKIINGTAQAVKGTYANFDKLSGEIELISSLSSPDKLTILASSELSGDLPYQSHSFLPDSLGIATTSFGHAYHQNLSILCELLAVGENLNGANVCIILSPGWFLTGTNMMAFLEFARPNFLRRIIHDETIPIDEKLHIARYINSHFSEIENPSKELIYFNNLYKSAQRTWVKSLKPMKNLIQPVKYNIKHKYNFGALNINEKMNFQKTEKRLEEDFLKTTNNNAIFVDSAYYATYLSPNGKYKRTSVGSFDNEEELKDFFMVLKVLKRHNCNATFIMQTLNPHHYYNLEAFNRQRVIIMQKLKKYNFNYLDLYAATKDDYKIPYLTDIMHLNNRGWFEVNKFLLNNYQNVQKQTIK